jgi:tetratricopeptide (TPR) repeat protein
MAKENQEAVDKGMQNIESALSRTEHYIEENRNTVIYVVLGIVALVAIYFAFKRFYIAPKEKEAESSIFMAQRYFEEDSFKLALDGDGANVGLIEIINSYGITKTANLACYQAGISFLRIGEYEEAIKYLKKFSSNDKMVSTIATGAIGDAEIELGQDKDAASSYMKAAGMNENSFTSPIFLMKAGQAYEKAGDNDKALKAYKQIKKDYPSSSEGSQVDKYITRIQLKK